MSNGKPAKTQKTGKRGGKTRTSWKPGQSGNPAGAPKRGESWTELIKSIGEMTGQQVAEFAGSLGAEFRKMPEGVTLKTLVVMRVYGQMINEPSPGLLNAFMERAEGKVVDKMAHEGGITLHVVYDRPESDAEDAA
jgi:hypothetical protein